MDKLNSPFFRNGRFNRPSIKNGRFNSPSIKNGQLSMSISVDTPNKHIHIRKNHCIIHHIHIISNTNTLNHISFCPFLKIKPPFLVFYQKKKTYFVVSVFDSSSQLQRSLKMSKDHSSKQGANRSFNYETPKGTTTAEYILQLQRQQRQLQKEREAKEKQEQQQEQEQKRSLEEEDEEKKAIEEDARTLEMAACTSRLNLQQQLAIQAVMAQVYLCPPEKMPDGMDSKQYQMTIIIQALLRSLETHKTQLHAVENQLRTLKAENAALKQQLDKDRK